MIRANNIGRVGYVDSFSVLHTVDAGNLALTTLGVHVPNHWVLGMWVIVIIVQVWGKYMIIGYLGALGKDLQDTVIIIIGVTFQCLVA